MKFGVGTAGLLAGVAAGPHWWELLVAIVAVCVAYAAGKRAAKE